MRQEFAHKDKAGDNELSLKQCDILIKFFQLEHPSTYLHSFPAKDNGKKCLPSRLLNGRGDCKDDFLSSSSKLVPF